MKINWFAVITVGPPLAFWFCLWTRLWFAETKMIERLPWLQAIMIAIELFFRSAIIAFIVALVWLVGVGAVNFLVGILKT